MTTMGNRFGVQGLGAEAVHSIRDVNEVGTSEVSRPPEVVKVQYSEIGSSHPSEVVSCYPENCQAEVRQSYNSTI